MHVLNTKYIGHADDQHVVFWSVGTKRKGVLFLRNVECIQDAGVAAEILAIRHLLFTKQVFNLHPFAGHNMELVFSSTLAKEVFEGKISRKYLNSYAHFYRSNLQGAILTAQTGHNPMIPAWEDNVPMEHIDAKIAPKYDIILTPALGEIRLTEHCIAMYAKRVHSGEPNKPVNSLIGRLKHPNLKRQAMPERVKKHKTRKYGSVENVEIWGHETSQMHYMVVRDSASNVGTLVTVYKRHPSYVEI